MPINLDGFTEKQRIPLFDSFTYDDQEWRSDIKSSQKRQLGHRSMLDKLDVIQKVSDVSAELLVGSGEKAFECGICGHRFAQQVNFRKHESIHRCPQEFQCHYCEYVACEKIDLKLHMLRHDKLFECNLCGYKFRIKKVCLTDCLRQRLMCRQKYWRQ